jgi:hypothetical protein
VVSKSENLVDKLNAATTVDQVRNLSQNIDDLNSAIDYQKDIISSAGAGKPLAGKNKRLQPFLNEYQDYFQVCQDLVRSPDTPNEKSYADCKTVADNVKKSQEDLIKLSFISSQIPNDIFLMPDKIRRAQDDYLKQQKLALETPNASKLANESSELAQDSTAKFMNYYIAGDEKNIRHYMTEAFENEFNFNDLLPDQREYSAPTSFRITSAIPFSDTEFQIEGNLLMTNHYTDNFGNEMNSKSVNKLKFRVIFDTKFQLWLVDSIDYSANYR